MAARQILRSGGSKPDAAARPVAVWQPDPVTGLVNRATPNDPLTGSPRTRTAYDKNHNVTLTLNPAHLHLTMDRWPLDESKP